MLDNYSRFVVALEAMHSEGESDMLGLLCRAVLRHGQPDAPTSTTAPYLGDVVASTASGSASLTHGPCSRSSGAMLGYVA